MAKVLCTGGAGFIASHLVDRLIQENHEVIVFDNLSTGVRANVNPKAHFLNMDICDRYAMETYSKTLAHIDFVFHLAAQINLRHSFVDPARDAETNIVGSINVISLAKKFDAKVIFASTGGAIYSSKSKTPWDVWAKVRPKSPYGLAKYTTEQYLCMLNVKHAILRLSNVYGPRQNHKGEAGVIAIFINNVLENQDLTIFGNGRQKRDFVYVDDVVGAFMLAMGDRYDWKEEAELYNISTGKGTDITTIADMIIGKMWANRSIKYAKAIPGELKNSILVSRMPKWKPQVSLDDGIARTIKYFSDIYKGV